MNGDTNTQVEPVIRRTLYPGDVEAIVDLHDRVYGAEYATNQAFADGVAATLKQARERGWPEQGGGVWLVQRDRALCGSLGLTRESAELARVRWFVFEPALRGRGLGAQLIGELVELARAQGMLELELETFSELDRAARIYRAHGFSVVSERGRDDWRAGRPMTYQRYHA